jgi:urea carboxylase
VVEKVLIANRGEIACRAIRTLRDMGLGSVAIYSSADAQSLHLVEADEAVLIGGPAARDSYLAIDRVLAAATATGAFAIFPGYGFLSESAEFAERCQAAGLVFIGPTVAQLQSFGLKHEARELAARAGVPLLPGSGLLPSLAAARAEAARIGFPVLLKSTAGGGGIGLSLCESDSELAQGYDAAVRLGENNFSQGGVLLEKFVRRARHIEIQIFGDGTGNVVALGERDCSAQRRNQKVVEETPAPGLSDGVRRAMRRAALRLTRECKYLSAGTVELLYDLESSEFY